jgi:uncharacterized protein involved in exopolysaccharide biosynthesis
MSDNIDQPQRSSWILDVLVVVAESWKPLLIVPVLAGVLVYGVSRLEPRTYESAGVITIFRTDEGSSFSPELVSRALKLIPNAPEVGEVVTGLKMGTPVQKAGRAATVSVTLTLHEPTMVQPVLNAVLREYQTQYLNAVLGEFRSGFQEQVNSLDQEMASRMKTIDRLEKLIDRSLANGGDIAALSTALTPLTAALEERERKKAETLRQVQLLPNFLISEKASPPVRVSGSRPLTATIFAVFGALAIVLIFLFTREIMRWQITLPGGAEKFNRIRRAFGLRPKAPADAAKS